MPTPENKAHLDCHPDVQKAKILQEDGGLLTPQQRKDLQDFVRDRKPGRIHKKDIHIGDESFPYGIVKGSLGIYSVCRDNKNNDPLAMEGGTAKVRRLRLEIPTDPKHERKAYVLKTVRADKFLQMYAGQSNFTKEDAEKYVRHFSNIEYSILKKLNRIDTQPIIWMSKEGYLKYGIIMEEAQGHELCDLISNRSLLPKDTKSLLKLSLNILKALLELHKAGILVRDIKPSNILINPETLEVVFIDFNGAEHYDFKKDPGVVDLFSGTPAYAPPEIFEGYAHVSKGFTVTYKSSVDIYCIGVVLRQLLLDDKFTYEEGSRFQSQTHSKNNPVKDPGIKQILSEMTHVDPSKRISLKDAINYFEYTLELADQLATVPSASPSASPSDATKTLSLEDQEIWAASQSSYVATISEHEEKSGGALDSKPSLLTQQTVANAIRDYVEEKRNKCFSGLRFNFFKSYATEKAQLDLLRLTNTYDPEKHLNPEWRIFSDDRYIYGDYSIKPQLEAYSKNTCQRKIIINHDLDEKRFKYAEIYISKNPHTTFAKTLAYAINDKKLKKTVDAAQPWWRKLIG